MKCLNLHTIVLASRNRGKAQEFRSLLSPMASRILTLEDLGLESLIQECGKSFAENARLKALGYSQLVDLPVLADDSGLEVAALGGRPGIHSARYAGGNASDADRIRKLLGELEVSGNNRRARFVCALALAQAGILLAQSEGTCEGEIALEPRGTNGFGYDPIFLLPELGKTFAELDESAKNQYSHRARAVHSLLDRLKEFH